MTGKEMTNAEMTDNERISQIPYSISGESVINTSNLVSLIVQWESRDFFLNLESFSDVMNNVDELLIILFSQNVFKAYGPGGRKRTEFEKRFKDKVLADFMESMDTDQSS